MLSFELTAIDLILSVAVVILLIIYITKLEPKYPDQTSFLKQIKKANQKAKIQTTKVNVKTNYGECPRGFGYIRKIGEDNSVSERCLGCYRIMECYEHR